jgi:hypothetical protein
MPAKANAIGAWRRRDRSAYAAGKALSVAMTVKISQTWFASHTGPIALPSNWRSRTWPRRTVVAHQTPAPKSAPPRTA